MLNFLLVEDDPDQSELMCRALKRLPYPVSIDIFSDVDSVLSFFEAKLEDEGFKKKLDSLNYLLILDLSLSGRSGFEVLEYMQTQPVLQKIPVVVLSATTERDDFPKAYRLNVVCFMRKPFVQESFDMVLSQLMLNKRILLS